MSEPIQHKTTLGHHGPLSPMDETAGGPPTAHHAPRHPASPSASGMQRGGLIGFVVLLALQAAIGGCLIALAPRVLSLGVPYAAAIGAMAITVNAILIGLLAGPAQGRPGQLLLLVSGSEIAGALACLGAVWASSSPTWLLLTLAGTLINMELVRVAAMIRVR